MPPSSGSAAQTSLCSPDFLRRLLMAADRDEVLSLVRDALRGAPSVQGFLIYLSEHGNTSLVCRDIHLPEPYRDLESTLLGTRTPLDHHDPISLAFTKGEVQSVDESNRDEFSNRIVSRFLDWRVPSVAVLPLSGRSGNVGAVALLLKGGERDCWAPVTELLRFAGPHMATLAVMESVEGGQVDRLKLADHQRRFLEFITKVNNLTEPELIYEHAAAEFMARYPFDLVAFLRHTDNALVARHFTVSGPQHEPMRQALEAYFQNERFWLGSADGATPLAFIQQTSFYFPDTLKVLDLPMSRKDREALGIIGNPRTFLIVPIPGREAPIGVLWLMSLDRVFRLHQEDRMFLEGLAGFLGTAILNAEMYNEVHREHSAASSLNQDLQRRIEELDRRASRDPLTGLYNYGSFEERLAFTVDAYNTSPEEGRLSLLMVDIDHFKRFNDTHGHDAGNAVLIEVARCLSRYIRSMDVACRYGGEEFVVILPQCDLEAALIIAERIRKAVAGCEHFGAEGEQVTVSVGVATYRVGESAKAFFKRTDEALYEAKGQGRNCVAAADPGPDIAN